ncbi:MAG: response regulator, partial [Balneolales bacterium]|nr:response regulator [Balneolales bacterium]
MVFQDGNPSVGKSLEKLSQVNSRLSSPIILREGVNYVLVEFSFHKVPDWLHIVRDRQGYYVRPFIIDNAGFAYLGNLNKNRAFLLGAVSLVLLILTLVHLYLWTKSVNRYHYYAFWTNFLLLVHAFTQMGDAVFDWTNSMLAVIVLSHPILFLVVFYNMIHVVGSYYKLTLPSTIIRSILGIYMLIVLYAVFFQHTLINITLPLLAVVTIIFALYLMRQALKENQNYRVVILFSGFMTMIIGAFLYVFVYLIFFPGSYVVFFLSIVLVYVGVPLSFTTTIAVEFVEIFEQMEEKVRERTKELKEKDEFKTRFFFNVSHELRTPTTILEGLLQKSAQNDRNSDGLHISQQDAPLVLRNMKRLTVLVQQILDLSRSDSGELILNRKHYRLDEIILNAMELIQSFITLRHQTIVFQSQTQQTVVEADVEKVTTILSNVILNASKYGPEHSEIRIETKINTSDSTVEIDITDEGEGVAEADREVIFERFHRIKNPDKPYVEGLGIGLELSRSLARLHEGDLVVVDEPAAGARFRLTLPIDTELQIHSIYGTDQELTQPEIKTESEILTTSTGHPIHLLLVEDNADMNAYINTVLRGIGTVHSCKNGSEALTYLQNKKPDVVITDLMMPVMSGDELVRHMKSDPNLSSIPIIVVSAKSDIEGRLELLRVGIVDYIAKPFNPVELRLKIENLMRYYWRRQSYSIDVSQHEIPEEATLSDNVKNYILEHIAEVGLTTSGLAEAFSMSERNFYRKIEKDSGMTPAAFIREVRLQYAALLVENSTDIRLKELASRVGYRSVHVFKRNYIERCGVSP